jgi:hypothetical protein
VGNFLLSSAAAHSRWIYFSLVSLSIKKKKEHTAMSFPAFSGLFPTFNAAAAAAPEEMPT